MSKVTTVTIEFRHSDDESAEDSIRVNLDDFLGHCPWDNRIIGFETKEE